MTEQDAAGDGAANAEEPEEPVDGSEGADGPDAADGEGGADDAEPPEGGSETLTEIIEDAEPDEELVERVAGSDAEEIAGEVAALRAQVEDLESQAAQYREELKEAEAEREDLESRLKRKQADFQNYKRRQEEKMEEVRDRATEDLVERLLDVRDNLRRALDQDEDVDIRDGVESTLAAFDEELDRENVDVIEPEPGSETDPTRHEVLLRVESDRPEGTIVEVHRPGYEMAGKVLREAQVTVSDGSGA
jgi:molecular chaperone GrpE